MITEIKSIEALQAMVQQDPDRDWGLYGQVDVKRSKDGRLILFSYGKPCQQKPPVEWNYFERISRGLILEVATGNVIARPFDKFFNWGQTQPAAEAIPAEVTEKMDGSLGIAFHYDNKWQVATRGSFDSDQALWATKFLNDRWAKALDDFPTHNTLLFEIIYPENRIVVNYGVREDLVLIGVRNRNNGRDYFYHQLKTYADLFDFSLPYLFTIPAVDQLLEHAQNMDADEEGFVVRFSDGTRYKIKGEEYLKVHRFISHFSFKRVLEAYQEGSEAVSVISKACPSMMEQEFINMCEYIELTVSQISYTVEEAHREIMIRIGQFGVSHGSREYNKVYAALVLEQWGYVSPYLFARRDGKDYKALILKRAFDKETANVEAKDL